MTLKVAFVIFFYWSPAEYQPFQIWTDLCPQKEGKQQQQQWQWIGEARHQLFQIRADGYPQEQQYESSGHKTRCSSNKVYKDIISWIIVSWISWFIIQHVEDISLDLIYPEEKQIMVTKFEYKYENKYEYPWIQIGEQIWYNYSVPGYKYDANMVSLDTNMIQI